MCNDGLENGFTCKPLFSFELGDTFVIIPRGDLVDSRDPEDELEDPITGVNSMCVTYSAEKDSATPNKYTCTQAPASTAVSIEDYRLGHRGQTCPEVQQNSKFTNQKLEFKRSLQANEGKVLREIFHKILCLEDGKCGFNVDTARYCPMYPGDAWFIDRTRRVSTKTPKFPI